MDTIELLRSSVAKLEKAIGEQDAKLRAMNLERYLLYTKLNEEHNRRSLIELVGDDKAKLVKAIMDADEKLGDDKWQIYYRLSELILLMLKREHVLINNKENPQFCNLCSVFEIETNPMSKVNITWKQKTQLYLVRQVVNLCMIVMVVKKLSGMN